MEFTFKSMEERSSNYYASFSTNTNNNGNNNNNNIYFSSPNNIPYFAHQAIRAGYASPELRRREIYRNPHMNLDFRYTIQRELEERIRAEIMAEKDLRRRLLEDEVRRELMIEREMALRRGGGGGRELGFGSTMRFDHRVGVGMRVPLLTNYEHRVGASSHREIGFSDTRTLPFQRDPGVAGNVGGSGVSVGVRLNEIKEIKGNVDVIKKDKVVFMAKPNATDLKRKATTPPLVAPVESSAGLKKPKTKDEWSCALCQITATSERALNDHLLGKKHKSRESGLNSQRTGFGTGPLLKIGDHSVAKPTKVPGASHSPSLKKDGVGAVKSPLGKVDEAASQNLPAIDQNSALMKEPESSVAKGEIGEASVPAKPSGTKPKKKFKYFCETCQVGAYSLTVMNAHKKGKRHLAQAAEPNKLDKISAQKRVVEEEKVSEELDIANSLEKGVVDEEKKIDISVANGSLEKGVDEEKKKKDFSVCVLEKGVYEDEKKKDTSVANNSLEKVVVEEEKKKDIGVANSALETGGDEEDKGKDISVANETTIESEEGKVEVAKKLMVVM